MNMRKEFWVRHPLDAADANGLFNNLAEPRDPFVALSQAKRALERYASGGGRLWVPASKQEWLDEVWKRLRVTLARSERKRWKTTIASSR